MRGTEQFGMRIDVIRASGTGDTERLMLLMHPRRWWMLALRGLFGIAFGIAVVIWPQISLAALLLVLAAYLVVDGLFAVVSALFAYHRRPVLLAIEGLINLGLAAVILMWPGMSLLVLVLATGIWALVTGALLLASSLALGPLGWLPGLAGVLSMLFGIVIVTAPAAGAAIIATWIGVYAVAFGAALLAYAWVVRRHATDFATDHGANRDTAAFKGPSGGER